MHRIYQILLVTFLILTSTKSTPVNEPEGDDADNRPAQIAPMTQNNPIHHNEQSDEDDCDCALILTTISVLLGELPR